jgi:DNA modification methylase
MSKFKRGAAAGQILVGDARRRLRDLATDSVDCVVTSPPYFLLRNYQHADQLGMESTVNEWVANLVAVLDEVARVLKPSGTVWLNVGDSYSRHDRLGAPPKALLLGPERLAVALVTAGWRVRNRVAWTKPNPMPASVKDRLTSSWECIYVLTRSRHYYFDLDAIRVPHRSRRPKVRAVTGARRPRVVPSWQGPLAGTNDGLDRMRAEGRPGHPLGKNPGDVWTVTSSNYRGAHFATFPEALVERPILAGCPARVCILCGTPWERAMVRAVGRLAVVGDMERQCDCDAMAQPGLVLDPFMGSGTTAVVAERLGRRWVGVELNPEFVELAKDRLSKARHERAAA